MSKPFRPKRQRSLIPKPIRDLARRLDTATSEKNAVGKFLNNLNDAVQVADIITDPLVPDAPPAPPVPPLSKAPAKFRAKRARRVVPVPPPAAVSATYHSQFRGPGPLVPSVFVRSSSSFRSSYPRPAPRHRVDRYYCNPSCCCIHCQ